MLTAEVRQITAFGTLWLGGCTFSSMTHEGQEALLRRIEFMSEYQESNPTSTAGTPRWVGLAVAVLGALSLLGLGGGWSAMNHANNNEQASQATGKQQSDPLSQRVG